MNDFAVPGGYQYLLVEVKADVQLLSKGVDQHPSFQLALIDKKDKTNKNYLYWSNRDIVLMTKQEYVPLQWNTVSANDMFTLDDYKKAQHLNFELSIYTDSMPINLKMKHLAVNVYGIKRKHL